MQRRLDATGSIANHMGTSHGQVITEDHTLETQLATQDVLQPAPRETSRAGVYLRVDNVGWHDCCQLFAQALERNQILCTNLIQSALVYRNRHMRVGLGPTMTREVLTSGGHACRIHAPNKSTGQTCRQFGLTSETAIANHRAALVIEIQHRSKAEVQSYRQYFAGHQPTTMFGQLFSIGTISQITHCR